MTCRQEIECNFKEKSRNELLDYVCDRIDTQDTDIEEMWNSVGKVLAYIETKDFSETFESVQNENYIRNKLQKMLTISKSHCVEHYKDNWKAKFERGEE